MKNLARLYSLDLRQIDLDINRTFRTFPKLWKSYVVDIHTKIRILQASVNSILFYGRETWFIP